ncbi:MAG: hypothetical protein GY757_05690 [bacterium]|nr:hypothetical protein [bacterium]
MKGNKITRRSFISGSLAGIASAGLKTILPAELSLANLSPNKEKTIIKRSMGRTGLQVPIVGMGLLNTRDPDIIKESFNMGVRLFDTAKAYDKGKNEMMLGQVLKNLKVRHKVFVQTKILHPVGKGMGRSPEPLTEKEIKEKFILHVNNSLKNLQTDYIDVLYYHAVDSLGRLKDPGIREALLQLRKEGKIRFTGISTHSKIIEAICDAELFDMIMLQLNVTMANDKSYLLSIQKAAARGLGIVAMKTQGGNRLAGSIMNHSAVLKWVLRNKWVSAAIPGYSNSIQLKENFSAAYDLDYNDAERKFIADRNLIASMAFCRWCGACRGDCPMGTDVSTLMRVHMYAFGYRNFLQATDTMQTIPGEAGLRNCRACSSCIAKCRHSVDIAANIDEVKKLVTKIKKK